jgi:signal transduction histidine kinase
MTLMVLRAKTWRRHADRVAVPIRQLVDAARQAGVTATVFDVALATLFLAAMLIERMRAASAIGGKMPLALALTVTVAVGLGLRRRAPVAGFLLGALALSLEALVVRPSPISPYANLIGISSLALYATRGRAWWGPPAAIVGVIAYFWPGPDPVTSKLGVLATWLLTWALSYSTARRREEQLRAQLALRAEAIAEERTHIARELHDLVGHTVTLMVVQAGAARRVLDHDPAQTRELLSSVEDTGREALGELDRMLGMLRQGEPGDEPDLASLPGLVERMGHAGIEVTVDNTVAGGALPRSMSMCAYRIIQEALTNALKHGHAGKARVTVRQAATVLDLEVSDDGRGVAQGYRPGRGLLGIGERVALFGGTVTHGGGEGGGFRLRASLPVA